MKKRLMGVLGSLVVTLALGGMIALPVARADPGDDNSRVQYRIFTCDNGESYDAGFVGVASGSFFLVDSTSVFAIKVFTEVLPLGEVKTFNYGIAGFDPSTLVTCSYTEPQGVLNIFSGFFTPSS